MELAAGAMDPLLRKLGELLMSELTLEKRVRDDVAALQREVAAMHAALRAVAEVPPGRLDEGAALWARDVRELSYDMEDAVDAFAVRVAGGRAARPETADLKTRLREFLNKTAGLFRRGKALHQIASAVGDAKGLAVRLGELRQRFGNLELPKDGAGGASTTVDPRLTALYNEAAELVGVDGAREELAKLLYDRSELGVKTVSLVGFGGLGKTTLAKAVYDRIKVQFDCAAFVSVSRNPEITRVFKKILYELDEERYARINEARRDEQQLIDDIRGFLQSRRYLIVIDDIWDEKTSWEIIKCAFPKNDRSSRLITTTRKSSVSEASCASTGDRIYKMKPLSETDSLRLFYTRIFHRGNACPPELEQVSSEIVRKCGGVPLAIISIASLLTGHRQIKPKDQWYALLNSIGRGLTDGGDVEDMQKILSFSYYDLPSHLKTCLLYLSIFPEDYDIERDRLIWRWIAEGFVQPEYSADNLFEIGERYFNELVNRNMIQPIGIDLEGRAQACRVHDIMLDLIRSLSRKENFVTVWDGDEQNTPSQSRRPRRLSIQNTSPREAPTSMSQVRSFTIFNPAVQSMPPLSQFQVLRVLDLEGCDLSKCGGQFKLRHVGSLAHLRYLGLRRTCLRGLPAEVGKLQFLQTLDLRGSHGVQELPPSITGLRRLMRLRLDWNTRLPNGLRNLTSLEELTGLKVGGDDAAAVVSELGHLTGLRLLTARWEEPELGEALVQSLGKLSKMQSLDVYVNGGRGDVMRSWAPPPCLRRFICRGPSCTLSTLPAWVNSTPLPCIASLDIWVAQVQPGDLHVLGALPALRGVRLRASGRVEDHPPPPVAERLAVRAGAFPCARACTFLHFATAPSAFPRGAMPGVQRLEFSFRAWDVGGRGGGLGMDDLRMGHLPSLEEVRVELWYHRKHGGAVEADRVAAALRRAAEDHPNRPALRIDRRISRTQG